MLCNKQAQNLCDFTPESLLLTHAESIAEGGLCPTCSHMDLASGISPVPKRGQESVSLLSLQGEVTSLPFIGQN